VKRYSLGLDFGTESVRALLVDVDCGEPAGEKVYEYPHGVLDETLPHNASIALGDDWFLQDPRDWIEGLRRIVPAVREQSGARPEEVIGIGLDFTSCTLLPTDRDGTPLCTKGEFRDDPQAWAKLWKHHGAVREALRIQQVAEERGEKFMDYFAHAISSEWLMPKVLETRHRSPRVYERTWTFVEACDWIPWQLTGRLARNACCAGFKAQYIEELGGYPTEDFLNAVDEGWGGFFETKMPGRVIPAGEPVGGITEHWAGELGLAPGTPVSAGMIDAHMGVPGVGITEPGRMALVLGTSFCHMMLGEDLKMGEGPLGVVKDGILSGLYAYESGQSAGGDIYAWFVDRCVPGSYQEEADRRGIDIHQVLTERAEKLSPGQSGLVALDWWNGNRSVLMDADLSGLLVGATLNTKPEEIYRALIEATAFGTRRILQAYDEDGIEVSELIACGGLPDKNPMVVQIFADVCNMPLKIAGTSRACAMGAAICGATAAGKKNGGCGSVPEAAEHMASPPKSTCAPRPEAAAIYDRLYAEYCRLHHVFGRENRLMHRLREIKAEAGTEA
jgi:L-ribulokinase